MTRNSTFHWVLLLLSSLVLLIILAPLVGMFLHSGKSEHLETVMNRDVQESIWLTICISFTVTFLFAAAAIPPAWLLARKIFPLRSIVQGIIDLPVVLPHSAAGITILGFISRDGFPGKIADSLGLNLINNPAGIGLAMAFVSIPFLINAPRDGFSAVPERLEKAALTLGASRTRVFFTISLPLAWRSIMTIFVMKGLMIVHVTHDYREAVSLASKIGVIHNGHLIQEGPPAEVFGKPVNRFVARYAGIKNFFRIRYSQENGSWKAQCDNNIVFRISGQNFPENGLPVLRSDSIRLENREPVSVHDNCFKGVVKEINPSENGMETVVDAGEIFYVDLPAGDFKSLLISELSDVWVIFGKEDVIALSGSIHS
ncbi:MAG: ABC transporter permease subunit [Bacteroidales bacterium]|nr:ABC transporter permease subunit [Bacteroidales bacterium]